jgi:hypothetical protein
MKLQALQERKVRKSIHKRKEKLENALEDILD